MPPTYEYECAACEHRFEEFQSMTDDPLRKCPECGKRRLRRLLGTGAGIIFKGSGFYETDYRKKSGGPAKGEGDSKSDGKSEAKSDAKPDSKAEGKSGPKSDQKPAKKESGGKPSKKGG